MQENATHVIRRLPVQRRLLALGLLLCGFWLALWLLGRQFTSDSGLGIWSGAWTENTSQWIADPYTFSHVLHGLFFCWMLLPLRRLRSKSDWSGAVIAAANSCSSFLAASLTDAASPPSLNPKSCRSKPCCCCGFEPLSPLLPAAAAALPALNPKP